MAGAVRGTTWILKPLDLDRGNGCLVYDVPNRGNQPIMPRQPCHRNGDRATAAKPADQPNPPAQFLHVPVAQGEAEIKPDRVLNDLGWKAMTAIQKRSHGS
jgi:hypothetical protein